MSENIKTQINGGGCVLMAQIVRMRVLVMASFFSTRQNGQESKCEEEHVFLFPSMAQMRATTRTSDKNKSG